MTCALLTALSTVPRRGRDPGSSAAPERALRGFRALAVVEQPVDGRACSADVRAERSQRPQLVGERRAREVVRRQSCEVAWAAHPVERIEQRVAARLEAIRG